MIQLRRISQLLFLGLFIYLIVQTVEPLASFIPVDLFFVSNPLIALGISVAGRKFVLDFLAALVIIIITVLLGRVFCGWVCPLGTTLDWFDRLFLCLPAKTLRQAGWLKRRPGVSLAWRRVKYIILVALMVGAILGVNAIGWLDPISLSFKGYGLVVYSALDWVGVLDGDDIFFRGSVIMAVILLVILLLSVIERRFWCRNLCPLGALLGLLSKWRLVRTHIGTNCDECGHRCIKVCKMGAWTKDEAGRLVALDEECIHCYNCVDGCPSKQISISHKAERQKTVSVLPSRRGFLVSGLLGVLSFALLKFSLRSEKPESPAALPILRPPGAERSEERFLAKCIRCGECMKVCPDNALQPLILEGGFYGMFSPILIPRTGYCLYECNLCGQVCPTGAIQNLPLEDKKQWKIGTARVDYDRCMRCLTCEKHCPVLPEKAIKVITRDGFECPSVDKELCIGCGACENNCLVSNPSAIRVFRL